MFSMYEALPLLGDSAVLYNTPYGNSDLDVIWAFLANKFYHGILQTI